jgi:hypothetical protein
MTTATVAPAETAKKTPTRRTRQPAKTGNPAADRTARSSAAKKNGATAPKNTAPAPAPAAPAAKIDKRIAKQALARHVMDAIAKALESLPEEVTAAMAPDEAVKIASQWHHHLPTGEVDGKRYWPASMPRPDRSDWR